MPSTLSNCPKCDSNTSFSFITKDYNRKITNDFFDNVVVNDENENMKKNRLELLEMFCNTFDNFIDFSKIEGA